MGMVEKTRHGLLRREVLVQRVDGTSIPDCLLCVQSAERVYLELKEKRGKSEISRVRVCVSVTYVCVYVFIRKGRRRTVVVNGSS